MNFVISSFPKLNLKIEESPIKIKKCLENLSASEHLRKGGDTLEYSKNFSISLFLTNNSIDIVEKKFASESISDDEASKIKVNKKEIDGFRKFEEFLKEIKQKDYEKKK